MSEATKARLELLSVHKGQREADPSPAIPCDAESSSRSFGSPAGSAWALQEGQHTQLRSPFPVLDVNDESPTFFPAVYNVSLPEDVARDFKVVRLNCTDADEGLNAELSYFITGEPGPEGGSSALSFPRERPRLPQSPHFCSLVLPSPAPPNLGRHRPLLNRAWSRPC